MTTIETFASAGHFCRALPFMKVVDVSLLFGLTHEAPKDVLHGRYLTEVFAEEVENSGVQNTDLRRLIDSAVYSGSWVVKIHGDNKKFQPTDSWSCDELVAAGETRQLLQHKADHFRAFTFPRFAASTVLFAVCGAGNSHCKFPYEMYRYDIFGMLVIEESLKLAKNANVGADNFEDFVNLICQKMKKEELQIFLRFLREHRCLSYIANDFAISEAVKLRVLTDANNNYGVYTYMAEWINARLLEGDIFGAMGLADKYGVSDVVNQLYNQIVKQRASRNQPIEKDHDGNYTESLQFLIRKFQKFAARDLTNPPMNPSFFCGYDSAALPGTGIEVPEVCKGKKTKQELEIHQENHHQLQLYPERLRHVSCPDCGLFYLLTLLPEDNILAKAEHKRQCLPQSPQHMSSWRPADNIDLRRRDIELPAGWRGLHTIREFMAPIELSPLKGERPILCRAAAGSSREDLFVIGVSYGAVTESHE